MLGPRASRPLAALVSGALLLGACANSGGGGSGETVGALGGAAAGGLLGSQIGSGGGNIAATVAGVALGALAGRELGRRLSGTDQERASSAERAAVSRNEQVTWSSPNSGNRGTIEPTRSYTNSDGYLCREYTHTVYVEGERETAKGVACRQSDGTWKLVG